MRGAWAIKLLDRFGSTNDALKDTTKDLRDSFQLAVLDAKDNLEIHLRARRLLKGVPKTLPRWQEVGADLLEHVCTGGTLPPNTQVALQLSNTLRRDQSGTQNLVPTAAARASS